MNKIKLPVLMMLIILITACTSTRITSSWRDVDKTIVIEKLNKVLVVALFKDETSRHTAEDQMAAYLNGKGVVSYNYLDTYFNKANEALLRAKIKADGFDGVVTMRLIDVDKEKVYTRGNFSAYPFYFRNFSGYYYRSWSNYSTPGYYSTTKTYRIETNVYSVKEDNLIWSGLTKTTDPNGVKKLTEEVAQAVYERMLREGFISK